MAKGAAPCYAASNPRPSTSALRLRRTRIVGRKLTGGEGNVAYLDYAVCIRSAVRHRSLIRP